MRIAIIGSGISGMTAAYFLSKRHDITLFESNSRLGGHTATIEVDHQGQQLAIDTGFIVFNDWTYPEFIDLLSRLGVKSRASNMSFSVSDKDSGLEYAGSNLNTLFAQRGNLFSLKFLKMIKDILFFNKNAVKHLSNNPAVAAMSLRKYLQRYAYSDTFINYYLSPMGAAIWSSSETSILDFSVKFFIEFFNNHGLLNIKQRPQWRVIEGGSHSYIKPLVEPFKNNIHLNSPIKSVTRIDNIGEQGVIVETNDNSQFFDQVVFACHSDQALKILDDASITEKSILSAIPYNQNEVVLHTDTSVLPNNKRCWSSWNVALGGNKQSPPCLTYNMNMLQSLSSDETFCVTLNQAEAIDNKKVIGRYYYDHPQFSNAGMDAQNRWQEINGKINTWYCGAYWRNGFHEDGVWSAKRVVDSIAAVTSQTSKAVAI